MLLILFLWLVTFSICYVIGLTLVNIINYKSIRTKNDYKFGIVEYFLLGFLSLSLLTGILSILIPVGKTLLSLVVSSVVVIFVLQFKAFEGQFYYFKNKLKETDKIVIFLLLFLIIFMLIAAAQKISLWDTQLYHSQSINWIRSFPVVPGLGNIHGRFAFNSMFFVISGLFTFEFGDVVVYPLNSLLFILITSKLIVSLFRSIAKEDLFKTSFYLLLLVGSVYLLINYINTPSPDITCTILIVYAIISLLNLQNEEQVTKSYLILMSLLIVSCMVYKLSYAFALLLLIPLLLKSKPKQSFLIMSVVGLLIGIPYLIRNYYLSGYLLFPYPSIDIFTVDWKVPVQQVLVEKFWIESWARIPGIPYQEVLGLKITEWFVPWLKSLNGFDKVILFCDLFLIFPLIGNLKRKQYIIAIIIVTIIINLGFWFINAPDPRFIHGFSIAGFAFVISYLIQVILNKHKAIFQLGNYLVIGLVILISLRFISFPINIAKNPKWMIAPAPMDKPEIQQYEKKFHYSVSLSGERCYNEEIPCVPYPLENVMLRGDDLSDGFKVVKNSN
ncbi:MAG: hypothetical protein AB7S50_01535 [Bacteroidales bacterium]